MSRPPARAAQLNRGALGCNAVTSSAPNRGLGRAPRLIIGLLATSSLLVANWLHPVLRFTWAPLNYVAMACAFAAPLAAAILATRLPTRAQRISSTLVLALPGLAALPLAALAFVGAVDTIRAGEDSSFLVTDAVRVDGTTLRAYQTNGGATTDYGFVVRQEKTVLPGLVVVRSIYSQYHAKGGRLRVVGPDKVQVVAFADGVEDPGPVLTVHRLLWN